MLVVGATICQQLETVMHSPLGSFPRPSLAAVPALSAVAQSHARCTVTVIFKKFTHTNPRAPAWQCSRCCKSVDCLQRGFQVASTQCLNTFKLAGRLLVSDTSVIVTVTVVPWPLRWVWAKAWRSQSWTTSLSCNLTVQAVVVGSS